MQTSSFHDTWCLADADYVSEYWQGTQDHGPTLLTLPTSSSQINNIDFSLELVGSNPVPNLDVWYLDNRVDVIDWPTGIHVNLFIDDTNTVTNPDYSDHMTIGSAYDSFDIPLTFDIKPGMVVTVSGNYMSNIVTAQKTRNTGICLWTP